MNDWAFSTSLRDIVYLLFSYKRVLFVSFFAVLIPTFLYTCAMTPVYETRVQILVERDMPQTNPMGSAAPVERPRDANNEMQILSSSTVLRSVIEELDLLDPETGFHAVNARHRTKLGRAIRSGLESGIEAVGSLLKMIPGNGGNGGEPDPALVREHQTLALAEVLRASLNLVPIQDSQIFEVYFACNDPRMARDINNSISDQYLQRRLELDRRAYRQSQETIDTQISDIEAEIAACEARRIEIFSDQTIYDTADELKLLRQENSVLRATIDQTEARLQVIRERLDSGAVPEFITSTRQDMINPGRTILLQRRGELMSQLEDLRNRYPADSREVLDMQRQLNELDAIIEQEDDTVSGINTEQRNPLWVDLTTQLETLQIERTSSLARLDTLQTEIEEKERILVQYKELELEDVGLAQQCDALRRVREQALADRYAAEVGEGASENTSITTIRIVEEAFIPPDPAKPKPLLYALLGVFLGGILGLSIVSAYAYFDQSVRSVEMAESEYKTDIMAVLPDFSDLTGVGKKIPLTYEEIVHLGLINSYRGVAQRLLAAESPEMTRAVLVSSSLDGEGATVVTSQLGSVIAREQGIRVLLIDANHRRGGTDSKRLNELWKTPASGGLLDVDVEHADTKEFIRNTSVEHLSFVSIGDTSGDMLPSEVAKRVKAVIGRVTGDYDLILIDTPPVVAYADYLALAPFVSGCVLVVEFGQTKRQVVSRALSNLSSCTKSLGMILNRRRRVIPEWLYRHL